MKHRIAAGFFALLMLIATFAPATSAAGSIRVEGKVYTFDKSGNYDPKEATSVALTYGNTLGTFILQGKAVENGRKDGTPSYLIGEDGLRLHYNYNDSLLNAPSDEWHLIEDKTKKLGEKSLNESILKGVLLLQTSKDRVNWVDVVCKTNVFANTPICAEALYEASDIQLLNGCYYRLTVAYSLEMELEEDSFLFIPIKKYDYKKVCEIYEFYAQGEGTSTEPVDPDHTFRLGETVRAAQFDGYAGQSEIGKNDMHYGWDLGYFYVSGYTDHTDANTGEKVFLKNVGDKVTLWFKLNQNIDAIEGNSKLSITADGAGYDQYFQTPKMNFGRGMLIVRRIDHNNNKEDPVYYANYLEGVASVDADTKVQLLDEGDYEVALDYEVTSDELVDKIGHYRIFFRFSIRNGNCMVFPYELGTNSELTNSALTENGFRLDLAMSRYLKINLKREVLTDSADGLVEDTRFNGPAKEGALYTEDGIYTITVSNLYTGQVTVKKIYVGTNAILRAHITTGLSIPEINEMVANGATISPDGVITLAQNGTKETTRAVSGDEQTADETRSEVSDTTENANGFGIARIVPLVLIVLVLGIVGAVWLVGKQKKGEQDA